MIRQILTKIFICRFCSAAFADKSERNEHEKKCQRRRT